VPKYKITVSKDQKKYTIVYEAETEKIAKDRVHKEWYSILSVSELVNEAVWNEIIFEIIKGSEVKKWKVISNDIFKTYLKLKDGLWYDIQKLYHKDDENKTEIEKQKILQNIKEQYLIYQKIHQKEIKKENEVRNDKEERIVKKDIKIDNFYLKKELEETYKLTDFVLEKLKKIIEQDNSIDLDKKEKFRAIYNWIIKIKSSTNISKLKEVWELALVKIWEVELETLEQTKSQQSKDLLSETNLLLKQMWSSKKFIEKEKDLWYIFNKIIQDVKDFFKNIQINKKTKIKEENIVDKTSNIYLKNALLLSKYKEKLKDNNNDIIKNISLFIFFKESEIKDNIIIRRSVIKQNIKLLDMKINWQTIQYTKIVKWYYTILWAILYYFSIIWKYLYTIIFIYSTIFLFLLNLDFFSLVPQIIDFNFYWLLSFLSIFIIYFVLVLSRGFITFVLNFVFLFFLIIFWVVNF